MILSGNVKKKFATSVGQTNIGKKSNVSLEGMVSLLDGTNVSIWEFEMAKTRIFFLGYH